MPETLTDDDYRRLLEFRNGLRRFLRWSESQAEVEQLTPAQHQLLLAIRGHDGDPTIGDVADSLLLRHHSVVGLVNRAQDADLVERRVDRDDQRYVRLRLTASGRRHIERLTGLHLEELARLAPRMRPAWAGLEKRGKSR